MASHEMGLLHTVHHCESMCEHMLTHFTMSPDLHLRMKQLLTLRDCADVCTLMAKYLARRSMFAKSLAALCAAICESCANECLKFPDAESQKCGQVCLHCASECRAFAM